MVMEEQQIKEIMKNLFNTNTGSTYNEDDYEFYFPESAIEGVLRRFKPKR